MTIRLFLILLGICALSALVLILYLFALQYYLYWFLWWYDILLHFLGGLIIGSAALWAFQRFLGEFVSPKRMLIVTLSTIIIVGIGWEIFEYFFGMIIVRDEILEDTLIDITMDLLGALFAYGIMYKLMRKFRNTHTV